MASGREESFGYSLGFKDLKNATFEDAEKRARECERFWFYKAQGEGYLWQPTRHKVEEFRFAVSDINVRCKKLEKRFRLLQAVAAMQGMAILFLAFTILLLR